MKKWLLGLTATLFAALPFKQAIAQSGTSFNFISSNVYANVGGDLTFDLNNANRFTVEAWVYPTAGSGDGYIMGNQSTTQTGQFYLKRSGSEYAFYVNEGTTPEPVVYSGPNTVIPNTWQHVSGVWDGSSLKIYINGTLAGTTTGATGADIAATLWPARIGNDDAGNSFMGKIDELRVWNVARSQSAIQNFMNCTVTDTAYGLLALYNFNEGVANGNNTDLETLHDNSSNGNDASLIGAALIGTDDNYSTDSKSNYLSFQSSIGGFAYADRLYNGASIDYDNDGDLDMLVTNDYAEPRVYLNDGKGHFSNTYISGVAPQTGWSCYSVNDLDNDGDDDFVVTNQAGGALVYINDGAGTYTQLGAPLINGTGTFTVSKIVDLNNDGKLDIVAANNNGGSTDKTEVWLNTGTTGSAAFAFSAGLNNFISKSSIATGDVDNDGDIDIITGSYSNPPEIFLNNANNGTFTQGIIPSVYSLQVYLDDWDNDGDLDFLTYDYYNNVGLRVFQNDGAGNFSSLQLSLLQSSVSNGCTLKDINGDGYTDALLTYYGKGLVYLNNGCQQLLQAACNYTLGSAHTFIEVADFNGDGTKDMFCGARDLYSSIYLNYLTPVVTPPLSTITSAPDAIACSASSAILTATATNGGTINWYNTAIGGSPIGSGSNYNAGVLTSNTTFYVVAQNANGCESTPREQVDVTLNNSSTGDTTAIVCGSINWYGTTYTSSGNPTHVLTNAVGCDSTVTLHLTVNTVDATVSTNSITLTANATGATYQWVDCNNGNSAISGETNQSFTATQNGSYAVIVNNGTCSDMSACQNVTTVSVNSINTASKGISVYPNPGTGKYTVSGNEIEKIKVFNSLGELVFLLEEKNTFDISAYPSGVYILEVTSQSGISKTRLIKN